jgi:hypothetical protein
MYKNRRSVMGLQRRTNWCVASVGGNAVSAFLSWRLQATNACDVTLVWKAGFDTVAQYGISIKCVEPVMDVQSSDAARSQALGNERFKPHAGRSSLNSVRVC